MISNWLVRMISAPLHEQNWLLAFEPLQPCDSVCILLNWEALVAAMYWHPTDQHVNEQVPWRFTFENNTVFTSGHKIGPGSSTSYQ